MDYLKTGIPVGLSSRRALFQSKRSRNEQHKYTEKVYTMKFTTSALLFACFAGAAAKSSIEIENTAYVGNDYGVKCEKLGKEKVSDKFGKPLVYCFTVKNSGDTYLNKITITNVELNNYFDNSIGLIAPGESKMVTIQSEITKSLVNNVVVTASPAKEDGSLIQGARKVMAKKSSEVVETISQAIARRLAYGSPLNPRKLVDGADSGSEQCLETKYQAESPGADPLNCAHGDTVTLQNLLSVESKTCVNGETIPVTIDAEILLQFGVWDLGWYIDTNGGDALTSDSCVVNGFQDGNCYEVLDPNTNWGIGEVLGASGISTCGSAGTFVGDMVDSTPGADSGSTPGADSGLTPTPGADSGLTPTPGADNLDRKLNGGYDIDPADDSPADDMSGGGGFDSGSFDDDFVDSPVGDNDECGDVTFSGEDGAKIPISIVVNTEMLCQDEDDDNKLDFSVCFSWRTETSNGPDNYCTFESLVPGAETDPEGRNNCFCSTYNVPNIIVEPNDVDLTQPC